MLRATPAVLRPFVLVIVALLAAGATAACQDDSKGNPDPCGFQEGDLVITEIFAEPDGADALGEWLELYNASGRELDLRGLRIWLYYNEAGRTRKRHTLDGDVPIPMAAGAYGVITNAARDEDSLWGYEGLLANIPGDGARIALRCDDGTLIDEVCFGEACALECADVPQPASCAFEFPDERSWTFQAFEAPDALANDDPARWRSTRPTRAAANPPPCLCPAPPEGTAAMSPGPGVVRITELFPNPAGDDGDAEWVELFVQADGWVDLEGVRLTNDGEEDSGGLVISRTTGCTLVEGGTYVLVAGENLIYGPPPTAPVDGDTDEPDDGSTDEPVDGATDEPAGDEPVDGCPRLAGAFVHQVSGAVSLGNASSGPADLALWKDGQLLDRVVYDGDHVEEDHAVQFLEGPDGEDEVCVAGRPYDTPWNTPWTQFGTPGVANPACGTCFCVGDEGTITEGVNPAPGELVITEVLPDVPGSEADFGDQEWFEALLTEGAAGGRDLACVRIRKKPDDSDDELVNPKRGCLHVEPGTYVVFAASDDDEANGGLPIVHAVTGRLSLKGDDGSIGLYLPDGTPLDEVENWGNSDEGRALQLDADLMGDDPIGENGAPGAWCDAFAPYGEGLYGTPGGANFSCTACYCLDEDDGWIEAPAPLQGELEITEVFGNTPGTEDGDLEWIEVRSQSGATRYLNCVSLAFLGDDEVTFEREDEIGTIDPTCAPIAAGDHAVLCADPGAAAAVGVPLCHPYDGRQLKGSDTVAVASRDLVLDSVTYEDLADGVSWMRSGDGSGAACDTPEPEADPTLHCWFACDTEDPFVGTPGSPNPVCPAN